MGLPRSTSALRRYTTVILAALAIPTCMQAQVSLYQFSQSVEPYSEISEADGGFQLGEATYWPPLSNQRAWVNTPFYEPNGQLASYLNPAIGPGYPIGFDFTFNGDVFDVIGVSHSGWISFGKSSDGNQAVWIYAIDHPHGRPFVQYIGGPAEPYKRNRVAGWGNGSLYMQDMSPYVPPGPVTTLRVATIGTAPNRVCVIQWKDFLNAYPPSTSRINFQIRLNEADNSVEVRYGTIIISTIQSAQVQVGLGGRVPEDFNSRMTVYEQPAFLYDWNYTVPGTVNTDACYATAEQPGHPNGTGIPPQVGLNWKWTPDACPPPNWPLTIDQMSFDSGHASWEPTASEYEYFLTDTNDIGGPEISSGTTTDPEAYFFGLEASTTYYLFVRSICDGEPGAWSLATPVETLGGGVINCDGTLITENYCSAQYSIKEWRYVSGDGSPLKIEFLDGVVDNNGTNAYFTVWDGIEPIGQGTSFGGNVAGQSFPANSGAMFIRLKTDVAACQAQEWYYELQWRIGCKNCPDPLVSFGVVEDCANMEYGVVVDIFNLGSSASVQIENTLGLPAVTASTTGPHTVGPFPAGQSVVMTVQNPDNPLCYAASIPLINAPCAIVGCGPDSYTYCYGNNELSQWAYQGAGGQEVGIRFIRGNVQYGDNLQSYNGLDIENLAATDLPFSLANKLITSGPPSTDRALVLALQSNSNSSCADGELPTGEWEYVVACHDGCTQPQGSFATACVSATQYEVQVTITDIGSTGSVQITNNGGAPAVTATAIGAYSVGPFNAGTPVTVELEGASILCTWTATGLVKGDCSTWQPSNEPDCEGTPGGTALPGTPCTTTDGSDGLWNDDCQCIGTDGISEVQPGRMTVRPNPSEGTFQLELAGWLNGATEVQVLDITGRIVGLHGMNGTRTTLDLGYLPNGLYTLLARNATHRASTMISIQH